MKKHWELPKAILFDLDGVLIDSEPLHGQAWKETASLFDVNLTHKQLKLLRGRRRIDCALELIKLIQKPIEIEDLLNTHKPISRRLIVSARAMDGSERLVKWCHKNNMPIALVTSSSSESLQIKTKPHEWISLFSTKVLGDEKLLGKGKPAPDPYLLAAKKLNVEPQKCWAVEDSISGATSALNAGCNVFLLKNRSEELEKSNFGKFNNHLEEIYKLQDIEKILNDYRINKVYL